MLEGIVSVAFTNVRNELPVYIHEELTDVVEEVDLFLLEEQAGGDAYEDERGPAWGLKDGGEAVGWGWRRGRWC